MGFASDFELYLVFRLIFLHSMMIFFTFTWNFKIALDPPQFMICFVLSLGIHLKFHLATRSYHVILTSTLGHFTWIFTWSLQLTLWFTCHLHMIFHVPSGFWEAKDPRMSQMLKECHRFASLFHSRKTWTQKRAQAQWSLWRPLFRLMFFHSFHFSSILGLLWTAFRHDDLFPLASLFHMHAVTCPICIFICWIGTCGLRDACDILSTFTSRMFRWLQPFTCSPTCFRWHDPTEESFEEENSQEYDHWTTKPR